jgi:hypothetical protein
VDVAFARAACMLLLVAFCGTLPMPGTQHAAHPAGELRFLVHGIDACSSARVGVLHGQLACCWWCSMYSLLLHPCYVCWCCRQGCLPAPHTGACNIFDVVYSAVSAAAPCRKKLASRVLPTPREAAYVAVLLIPLMDKPELGAAPCRKRQASLAWLTPGEAASSWRALPPAWRRLLRPC